MKILIVTDAWLPQVNGVVTTLLGLRHEVQAQGHEVVMLTHHSFSTFALPSYPEIQMAYDVWKVPARIREIDPDAVHIATPEGTLGMATKMYCNWKGIPHTSSYHTKLPEYLHMRAKIPLRLSYAFMRWCHKGSRVILVTTASMVTELNDRGFKQPLAIWTRGCDHTVFNESYRTENQTPEKVLLYAGRLSIEKNLEAFLNLDIPGTRKIVVGDGPERHLLEHKYPDADFVGYKQGKDLAAVMANADVFVFPSKTDTFGIVMIEAAACGTPVAAFPVTGPLDFVVPGMNGALSPDLSIAIKKALRIDRSACAQYTKQHFTWQKCAQIFLDTLVRAK